MFLYYFISDKINSYIKQMHLNYSLFLSFIIFTVIIFINYFWLIKLYLFFIPIYLNIIFKKFILFINIYLYLVID
jgi:hypothetical protein